MSRKRSDFKILFLIKKDRIKKDGKVSIRVRVSMNGKREEWLSGAECYPEDWSPTAGKILGKKRYVVNANQHLTAVESRIREVYKYMLQYEKEITAKRLYELYFGKDEEEYTILTLYKKLIERKRKLVGAKDGIEESTFKKYLATYNKILDFLCLIYREDNNCKDPSNETKEHKEKRVDCSIRKVDYEFILTYETYLKSLGNCGHNAAIKHLRYLKNVTSSARKSNIIHYDPFEEIVLSSRKTTPIFLLESEIGKIIKKKFTAQRLEEVRDIFIFCCFTGLAYADVSKLKAENIFLGRENKRWICKDRTKTEVEYNVPLFKVAEAILNKYNSYVDENGGYLLPVKVNQKMNEYLKEIATLCEINKNLTTHVARHTFATQCLTAGVSIEAISKMLGHRNIKTTQIYAQVLMEKVNKEMGSIKKKLDKYEKLIIRA